MLLVATLLLLSVMSNTIPNVITSTEKDVNSREYLCGTCDEAVTWEQQGIICETCDQWYHAGCQNIGDRTYQNLGDSDLNISWHCIICNNPNYSTSVHDLFSNEVTHCSSRIGTIPDISSDSPDPSRHRLKPLHTSTPSKKPPWQTKLKVPLRILNVNFQSIKLKQCRLSNILESVKPDILIGTETWLDPNIKDSEIFPSGYRLHRKDKVTSGGGGVLIAVKNEYNSEDVPELDANCEIVWAK